MKKLTIVLLAIGLTAGCSSVQKKSGEENIDLAYVNAVEHANRNSALSAKVIWVNYPEKDSSKKQ